MSRNRLGLRGSSSAVDGMDYMSNMNHRLGNLFCYHMDPSPSMAPNLVPESEKPSNWSSKRFYSASYTDAPLGHIGNVFRRSQC
ncbi:hypothetical protein MUCCIDRAFT_114463 [Mucor lusitanicus CBS 277.49]|uniref:Uncharacterized protein n=1 Tax=Mucor lusitanicus CBS 277.49 TaxID=747725 RepID=A0A168HWT9_MUCCL|nr:hypothetical protein MUCCIDRAFT_114463 [Mucor lusitanicus CBS 277.49]